MPYCADRVRTTDIAAWIDSCMTSPSLPVKLCLPFSRHDRRLNRQQFAADFCPGESRDLTDPVSFFYPPVAVPTNAKVFVEIA